MIKIVRSLDEDVWQHFIANHPDSNVFHTPEMFKVFASTKSHYSTLWAAVDNNNYPLALLLPIQITLFNDLLSPFTTRSISYGSLLYTNSNKGEEAIKVLLNTYKQNASQNILFTELRNLTNLSYLQPILTPLNFNYEEHFNYLININYPPETVLQNIGRRTRKLIRKGLREKNVNVTEATTKDEFDGWYKTLQKTYQNAQVPLADFSLFEAAFDELHHKGMIKFLLAKVDGVIAACSAELVYKDMIYGWYGGLNRDYSKSYPTEMLMWYILEWGASNGYRVYDFGGAGKPGEMHGVRSFKAKFGGDLVEFGRFFYTHAPLRLQLSTWGYNLYRKFL